MQKAEKKELVRLSVNVEKSLKDEFIRLAKENNTDSNKLIRAYILKYVSVKNKEK